MIIDFNSNRVVVSYLSLAMYISAGYSAICHDIASVGHVIQDICYYNARNYLNWQYIEEPEATIVKA